MSKAQASFAQLDLAALWPEAPQTLLTGNAQVEPQGAGWQAQINLLNRLAGPWDQGRVPVDSAKAQVEFADGRWNIQSLNADGAGGHIKAQGKLAEAASIGALSGWQVQAQLQGINPALVHGKLVPARLDGMVQATATKQVLAFDVTLQPAGQQPAASKLQGLRLQTASAKGQWTGAWLQLQSL